MVRAGLLVALAAFGVYMASFRSIATVDVVSNVLLGYSIARDRDLYLDEFVADDDRLSFYRITRGAHALPVFPWGAPLLAAPFAALGEAVGISPPDARSVTVIGKLAAAAAAATSVFFVFLLSARIAGRRWAIVSASLYAFGTATWPVSGGGLWQHGPAQALLAAMLYVVWPSRTRAASATWAGLLGSGAALVRVQDAAFAAAAGAYLAQRRLLRPFLVASVPAVVAYVGVSLVLYGTPISEQYGIFYRTGDAVIGVLGNLVSPSRGIFVLSPFLVLAASALVQRARVADAIGVMLRWQLAAAAMVLVAHGSYVDWMGGHTYGNRYLADTLPLLAAGLALWLRRHHRSRPARWLLAALSLPAVAVAGIGALLYDQSWSWEALDIHPRLMWQPDRWQPWYTASNAGPYLDGVTLLSLLLIAAAWAGLAVMFLRATPGRARRAGAPPLRPVPQAAGPGGDRRAPTGSA